jgi:hypothetical protein
MNESLKRRLREPAPTEPIHLAVLIYLCLFEFRWPLQSFETTSKFEVDSFVIEAVMKSFEMNTDMYWPLVNESASPWHLVFNRGTVRV